jgi:hypothetical protein
MKTWVLTVANERTAKMLVSSPVFMVNNICATIVNFVSTICKGLTSLLIMESELNVSIKDRLENIYLRTHFLNPVRDL